jgi:hypothetical protein
MKINLRVKYDGNKELTKVVCSAADLVAFEEKYDRSVARLEKEFKITDLLFLAWHSEKRTKATEKEFNDWLNDIESVEPDTDAPKK